jgi:nucleotide-binding universal stress UspA family protein
MINHILVPLDGSPLAECVLPHTVAIAKAFDARVSLLRVLVQTPTIGQTSTIDPLNWQIRKSEAKGYLDRVAVHLQEAGLRAEPTILEGQAAERVIQFARDHDVNLIILSSHGRSGLSGWNVSSVVQKVILRAYVATMIVRAYLPTSAELTDLCYRRLLVPLDCSQRAECVFPLVSTLARFHGAWLILAHVVRRPEMPRREPSTQEDTVLIDKITKRNQEEATRYLEQLESRMSTEAIYVRTRLAISDDVPGTLQEMADEEKVDLVVLSAHGYSGKMKWPFGSAAISFIAYGTTPLLIVQDISPDDMVLTPAEAAAREQKGH